MAKSESGKSPVRWEERNGIRIFLSDFSSAETYEAISEIAEEAIHSVRTSLPAPKSVRIIIDLTGLDFDSSLRKILKKLSKQNGKYTFCLAIVGLPGFWNFLVRKFFSYTGRSNHRVFKNRNDAYEWISHFKNT